MVYITTLVENTPSENKSLRATHGLSFLVETESHRLLFDCGPDNTLLYNSKRLGKELDQLDAIVVSHHHYDHAGGLLDLLEENYRFPSVYIGPGFFERKYAFDGKLRYTCLDGGITKKVFEKKNVAYQVVHKKREILPGIFVVGGFQRTHERECIAKRFVRTGEQGIQRDDFEDEICLVIDTKKGLVVLLGCSHPGVLNILSTIAKEFSKPIYSVLGGTHLVEADDLRLEETLQQCDEMNITRLGFCHCSGEYLKRTNLELKNATMDALHVGDMVIIDE